MARDYQARCAARLTVPTFLSIDRDVTLNGSETVTVELKPLSFRWVRNNYLTADELELTAVYKDIQVDPRILQYANIEFYLADTYPTGILKKTRENLRFAGTVYRTKMISPEADGWRVEFRAYDYRFNFINMPVTTPELFPTANETLEQAYVRIQQHVGFHDVEGEVITSSVSNIPVEFRGNADPNKTLGGAVDSIFTILGANMIHKHSKTAWDVWTVLCQAAGGYITFMDVDKVVVQDVESYYADEVAANFEWGSNILSCEMDADSANNTKGLVLRSFNPIAGTYLESFWPPIHSIYRAKKRRVAAQDKIAKSVTDYEVVDCSWVQTQDQLDALAHVAYLERQRENLRGKLTTHEMQVENILGEPFDLLNLRAGDAIRVAVGRNDQEQLILFDGFSARKQYLLTRGYSDEMATLIARSTDGLRNLSAEYHVSSVAIGIDNIGGDDPKYSCDIEFHNIIQLHGDAIVGDKATSLNP